MLVRIHVWLLVVPFIALLGCGKGFKTAKVNSYQLDLGSNSNSVKIDEPADNALAKDGVTLKGKCVPGLSVTVGGAGVSSSVDVPCESTGFSVDILFSNGDGIKNVIVTQLISGREVAVSRSFRRDATPPVIQINTPAANSAAKSGVQVDGTCEPGIDVKIYGPAVAAASSATCSPTGAFTAPVVFSDGDGVKAVFFAQTDAAGNITTLQRSFMRDTVAPMITLTGPAQGTSANSGLTLVGTCETGIAVDVKGAGIAADLSAPCAAAAFSIPIVFSQGDGAKAISVSQSDAAGNMTSVARSFNRLSVGPAVAISQPAANTVARTGVTVQGTCANGLQVTIAGTGLQAPVSAACTNSMFSSAVTFSNGDGSKNVTVAQTDAAGNMGMDSRNFVKDTVGPNLTITAPTANLAIQTSTAVRGACENGSNVTVAGTGLAQSYSMACTNNAYNVTVSLSAGEGNKAIDVSQSDSVGNATMRSVQVVRDSVAPAITLTSPAANTSAANGLTLVGTCEVGLNVEVSGTGVSAMSSQLCSGGTFSMAILFSNGDGTKAVTLAQTDAAGNRGTVSRNFVRATPSVPLDGVALYTANCSSCHGGIATTGKRGRTAAQITGAIGAISSMSGLSTLSTAQISAIADALSGTVTPPPPMACTPDTIAKPAVRRLNAREFTNSIRDVIGVAVNPTLLPGDDLNGLGFDTDGSILRVTDLDSQKYLDVVQAAVTTLYGSPVKTGFDFTCAVSATETTNRTCTSTKLSLLAQRAFKKVLSAAELKRYVDLARTETDTTEGLKTAMTAMLLSPYFLYFNVDVSKTTTPVHTLTDLELAHKLSLMIWSSVPDDGLRNAAMQGQLKSTLKTQVIRMVADAKFNTGMGQGFVDRWLELAKLNGIVRTDATLAGGFTDAHMQDMIQESRLFVQHIIRNDRPMGELLTAQYSFVNQRLAPIYGVSGNFTATAFPMTNMPANQRSGLLTHGSIMTLTGKLDSTSPVKRGFWMTKRVLCSEPSPPPPDIPPLDTSPNSNLTVKQRLAAHRTNATCAACHSQMDPIGIGLENMSQIGKWRTTYGQSPVDATETLNNVAFNGPVQLGAILATRDDIKTCITDHLASYSLGRATAKVDDCYVQQVLAATNASTSKGMLTLLQEMVASPLFTQQKVGE